MPRLQSNTQAHSQAITQSSSCVRQEDFVTFDSEHQMLLQEVGRDRWDSYLNYALDLAMKILLQVVVVE